MKNYAKIFILPLWISLVVTSGCTKEEEVPALEAEISILSPTAGQTFAGNQTVLLQADISAETELHGWQIQLRRKSDNTVIYEADRHIHGTTLQIREQWVNTLSSHTDLILEVTAALDHNSEQTQKASVAFHCHPD
jgi:hypothetical protein